VTYEKKESKSGTNQIHARLKKKEVEEKSQAQAYEERGEEV